MHSGIFPFLKNSPKSFQEEAEKAYQAKKAFKKVNGQINPHNVRRRDNRAAKNLRALFEAREENRLLNTKVVTLENRLSEYIRPEESDVKR
ncbi:hypothetical protein ElyMa_000412400 [Elysia marginata]|uniref:BZIP domain-containing protein n=1 Tax=Elysia marginata TaxID=1093978 RepID=A0AAV4FN63_9GAST|nr:hypothetical protein ElyMa_000412400 [Elysia marginata]